MAVAPCVVGREKADTRLTFEFNRMQKRPTPLQHVGSNEGLAGALKRTYWFSAMRFHTRCAFVDSRAAADALRSDLRLFRDLRCIVDLDTEVAYGRLEARVTQQQLHRSQVLRPRIHQRRGIELRRVLGRIKPELFNPAFEDPSVL